MTTVDSVEREIAYDRSGKANPGLCPMCGIDCASQWKCICCKSCWPWAEPVFNYPFIDMADIIMRRDCVYHIGVALRASGKLPPLTGAAASAPPNKTATTTDTYASHKVRTFSQRDLAQFLFAVSGVVVSELANVAEPGADDARKGRVLQIMWDKTMPTERAKAESLAAAVFGWKWE
jgi:hypothetical protein